MLYNLLNKNLSNTCYWGQFVILDMEYMSYFSNYKKNDKEFIYSNLKKTKSFKDLILLNSEDVNRRSLNTLQVIYETQFEFDEDIYNVTSNNIENDNNDNNDNNENKYGNISICSKILGSILLCITAFSIYIIII